MHTLCLARPASVQRCVTRSDHPCRADLLKSRDPCPTWWYREACGRGRPTVSLLCEGEPSDVVFKVHGVKAPVPVRNGWETSTSFKSLGGACVKFGIAVEGAVASYWAHDVGKGGTHPVYTLRSLRSLPCSGIFVQSGSPPETAKALVKAYTPSGAECPAAALHNCRNWAVGAFGFTRVEVREWLISAQGWSPSLQKTAAAEVRSVERAQRKTEVPPHARLHTHARIQTQRRMCSRM